MVRNEKISSFYKNAKFKKANGKKSRIRPCLVELARIEARALKVKELEERKRAIVASALDEEINALKKTEY